MDKKDLFKLIYEYGKLKLYQGSGYTYTRQQDMEKEAEEKWHEIERYINNIKELK